ncbi:hypothetical protein [Pollutibacter soli]|uniref:hypothetical protein n=1 Tax=Pollutibacter soli TaxID=3034157 RepID=UPI00301337C0
MDDLKIRCPKCHWQPDGKPHWSCSCGTIWDTFSTGGRCPGCGKQWHDTQCIVDAGGCQSWSPHLDWYENLDDFVEEVKEVLKEPVSVE